MPLPSSALKRIVGVAFFVIRQKERPHPHNTLMLGPLQGKAEHAPLLYLHNNELSNEVIYSERWNHIFFSKLTPATNYSHLSLRASIRLLSQWKGTASFPVKVRAKSLTRFNSSFLWGNTHWYSADTLFQLHFLFLTVISFFLGVLHSPRQDTILFSFASLFACSWHKLTSEQRLSAEWFTYNISIVVIWHLDILDEKHRPGEE